MRPTVSQVVSALISGAVLITFCVAWTALLLQLVQP